MVEEAREQQVNQADRMNSASNSWEADPWDASDDLANEQLAGFQERAARSVYWTSISNTREAVFGIEFEKLISADVQFFATHEGEDMLLMQSPWHGFPDPPEWRLATRPQGQVGLPWTSWGYFDALPNKWQLSAR